jgi:D-glycero-alpha-D-manno-heptose-7-phosphate kinase
LHALQGKYLPPDELASLAIEIEQKHLGETVGCQDQTFAAYGGLNTIQFRQNGDIVTSPLSLSVEAVHLLESHLMLFFTGIPRTSSEVAATYVPQLHEKERQHHTMLRLAEQGIDAIYRGNLERLGWLIDQSWRIKAGLSSAVTNASINETYATARLLGAFGGKLTGAGGGGSLLLVVAPEKQKRIADAMSKRGCVQVPFRFTQNGSSVIFYDRDSNAN